MIGMCLWCNDKLFDLYMSVCPLFYDKFWQYMTVKKICVRITYVSI